MSFFFNSALENLKQMDEKKGNINSVVLSNVNFRKAMSLAINRAEYVTATEGYTPAFALLNKLYYYDFYNDPTSAYRNTTQAKEAILNLYGVKYGAGTPYETIDKAVASITGYNLEEAKKLMKTACEELVEDGIYTAGEEIKIKIGWAKGALTSADQKQITLINNMINAALEGSGFGKITLEGVGNLPDRYGDVGKGEFAIGYGAWGGAALYPFTGFRVYMDPDYQGIHEAGCWDPKTEELTLTINGEEVTMTWQAWSKSMADGGKFTDADFETKLTILSTLETKYLKSTTEFLSQEQQSVLSFLTRSTTIHRITTSHTASAVPDL
jgi:oligopeptide transport system substrate-binding protein